jgi:site-specific DNA recombinase
MKKYAVLLNRVSTGYQDNSPQETALRKEAISKGYTDFHIIETKESGLIHFRDRKGTNDLLDFLGKNKEYKSVFCTEMSRLGRRESDLHLIKNWFKDNKIQFYLIDKKFQLFNEAGNVNSETELLFTLYGYFAENEITQKQDRFKRAKIQLALEGYSISGKRLFGYDREKDTIRNKNKYVVNVKETSEIVNIFNWYAKGFNNSIKNPSIKLIVLECKKKNFSKYTHSKRNVNKLLKEKGYLGQKTTNNRRKNPNYVEGENKEKYIFSSMTLIYPQIISLDLFSKVQDNLKNNNSRANQVHRHTTILSKLILCKECNRHFQGQYKYNKVNGDSMNAYRCGYTRSVIRCDSKFTISMRLLDSVIWSVIKDDLPSIWKYIVKIKTDKNIIKVEIENLEKLIQDLTISFNINQKKFESMIYLDDFEFSKAKINYQKSANKIKNEIFELKESIHKLNEEIINESSNIEKNLDKIILKDILLIESSKDRLKEIINLFVKEIKLVHQDQRYSVIDLTFNNNNEINNNEINNNDIDNIKYYTTIIIDKRDTNRIKIVKALKVLEYKDNQLFLKDFSLDLGESFGLKDSTEEQLRLVLKTKNPYEFLFKKLDYLKLNLYNREDYSPEIVIPLLPSA